MELTHDFTVPAPIDRAWATLMDLERVGGCFPGATVDSVTEDGFAGSVKVKLGPIALVYLGSGSFLARDDVGYHAVIEAKGKDKRGNGTAGATVTIHLTPSGSGTRVDVTTDLAITGKPAQFGRGVMQDVSDKLLQQFVTCIESQIADSHAAQAEGPADAAPPTGDPVSAPPAGDPVSPPDSVHPEATAADATDNEPIDLGATVLPIVLRAYAPHVLAALAGVAIGILIGRRQRAVGRLPFSD